MDHALRARTTRRSARLLIGALAVGALGATVVTGATAARQGGQRELDQSARIAADTAAVAIDQYFREARSTILIAARNPAFADFYERATTPAAPVLAPSAKGVKAVTSTTAASTTTTTAMPITATRTVTSTQDDVLSALRSFHDLYPDSVGETCFIDRLGPENARLVNGVAAATADLSKDESQNPFFAPTLTMPVGQVFQARPYLSPDTNDWVVSNSTMLVGRSGTSSALLHFEVSVESFRRLLRNFTAGLPAQIVDGTSGAVIVDSLAPQAKGGALGRPAVGKPCSRPVGAASTGTATARSRSAGSTPPPTIRSTGWSSSPSPRRPPRCSTPSTPRRWRSPPPPSP